MADIKINILDFCGNNHWHYEIVINGERFISGWYQYNLPFIYTCEYCYHLEHFPNGATEYQIKKLNNKYGLVEFTNRNWAKCFTHEAIDLVKGIRYMYHIIIYLKTNEYNELNEIAFKQMVDRLSGIYEIK